MKKGCCFAGHHKLPYSLESKIKVTEAVEDLIKQGVTEFYAGGVTGFNMLCSMVVLNLRVTYPEIKLHIILPYLSSNGPHECGYKRYHKDKYNMIMTSADSVEYTSRYYWDGCIKKQNRRLISFSDYCLCCFDPQRQNSFTAQAIRFAKAKEMKIINIF